MNKKVWLWLAFLILLLSFLGCEAELPTSPDIPEAGFPIISYFRATPSQILTGECSILSWNVHVSGLASHHTLRVVIHFFEIGIPEGLPEGLPVERRGTLVVHPEETTVYKLTASIGGNSVSKEIAVSVGP